LAAARPLPESRDREPQGESRSLGNAERVGIRRWRKTAVSETCVSTRKSLRDDGAGVRQDQHHAKRVQIEPAELLAGDRSMEGELSCADLSKNDLAREIVRSFGEVRLRVTGSSMLPAIRANDELVVHRCRFDEAVPGEIVLFTRHHRLFAHRVVARTGGTLVTQGDGIADPDPPICASQLLGKVVRVQRRGKPIRLASTLTLSQRIAAALVRRSATAGRLLARLHDLQHRAVA